MYWQLFNILSGYQFFIVLTFVYSGTTSIQISMSTFLWAPQLFDLASSTHRLLLNIFQHSRPSQSLAIQSYGKFSSLITVIILLTFVDILPRVTCQDCLKFSQGQCLKCPSNSHFFNGSCFQNILRCKSYEQGSLCRDCEDSSELTEDKKSCVYVNVSDYGLVFSSSLEPKIKLSSQFYNAIVSANLSYNMSEDQIDFVEIPSISYDDYYANDLLLYMKQHLQNKASTQNLAIENLSIENKIKMKTVNTSLEQGGGNYFRAIFTTKLAYFDVLYKVSSTLDVNSIDKVSGTITIGANLNPSTGIKRAANVYFTLFEIKMFDKMEETTDSDRIISHLRTYIGEKYPFLRGADVLSASKSVGPNSTLFQILIQHKNLGLNKAQIKIGNSFIESEQKEIELSSLSSHTWDVLLRLMETQKYGKYLKNSQIYKVSKIMYQKFPTYNVSFNDKSIAKSAINSKNGKFYISYIVFQLNLVSKSIQIKGAYMHEMEDLIVNSGIANRNAIRSTISSSVSLIDLQGSIQPPKLPYPNNKTIITDNLTFQEILDIISFRQSSVFIAMRNFLQQFYTAKVLSYDLIRVLTLGNDTTIVIQVVYKVYGAERANAYYTFALDIKNKSLELVGLTEVPLARRNVTKISDFNRNQMIQGFSSDQLAFYQSLVFEPFYDFSSFFIESTSMNYTIGVNASFYGGKSFPQQKFVSQYSFKYYYPPILGKSYEYVEFRYAVETYIPNQANPANRFVQPSRIKRSIGNVVVPKEIFEYMDLNSSNFTKKQINLYASYALNKENINQFQIIQVRQSKLRNSIFRALIRAGDSIYFYEIDLTNAIEPFMLSLNRNTSVQMFSQFSVKPTLVSASLPLPPQLQNFPQRALRIENITIKPQSEYYNDFQTQLTTPALRKIISELFNRSSSISGLEIVRRQTISDLIDLYVVDFNDEPSSVSGLNGRKRLEFFIPKFSNFSEEASKKLQKPPSTANVNQSISTIPAVNTIVPTPQLPKPTTNSSFVQPQTNDSMYFPSTGLVIPKEILDSQQSATTNLVVKNTTTPSNPISNPIAPPSTSPLLPATNPISTKSTSIVISDERLKQFIATYGGFKSLTLSETSLPTFVSASPIFNSPYQYLIAFLFNTSTKYTPSKYSPSNRIKSLNLLPREEVAAPSKSTSDYILQLLDMKDINMTVKSQRKTTTSPPIIISDLELRNLKDNRTITDAVKLRVWLSYPQYSILHLELQDDDYVFAVQSIDDKFLAEFPLIAKVQGIIATEIEDYLDNLYYNDILPENKYKRKYIMPTNLINLRTQRVADYQKIELYYELKEAFIKSTLFATYSMGKYLEIHIVSLTVHGNGIKALQEENKAFSEQQIMNVRKNPALKEVEWQIFKQYGNVIDEKTISNVDLKQIPDQVLINLRYSYKNTTYSSKFIYSKPSKRAILVSHIKTPANETINSRTEANPQLIRGCKKRTITGVPECLECEMGYVLGRDRQCYPRVKNCLVQSGMLCITCLSGYFFDGNFRCS